MLRSLQTKKQRFSFRRTLWVVIAINAVLFLFTVGIMVTTSVFGKQNDWSKTFSWQNISKESISILFTALYFYITLNYFHWLIFNRKKAINYVPVILISMVGIISYHFLIDYIFVVRVNNKVQGELTVGIKMFGFTFISVFVTGASLLTAYLTSLRDEQKQRKILEQQKLELEIEKSQANLNFLKAQINPHFLHNTLNFLYAKALPLSEELSEGIATLSDIMRYALSEGNTRNGKALLREEIEHVQNVIKINQLRFSNNLKVNFEVEGIVNGARIIPFVLITLVENAFKHGDLKSPEHPIEIKIHVNSENLNFYCRNKKKTGSKELSTGLGLDNIQKRLDLAYGSSYSFYVKDGIDFYTTELTIKNL